jgi:hypothetical protein
MDDTVFVQEFQPGHCIYKLFKRPVPRKNKYSPFTHEMQAIVILVGLDEVHDISLFHSLRGNRNEWRYKHNAYKRQDVLMSKPLPSNNIFDKELRA